MRQGLDDIQRIVVRGTNWVGDAVMTIPALRALRQLFPEAHITLATRPWAKGLFAEVDFLDDLLVHDASGLRSVVNQVMQWRIRRFDVAVLFPNSLESALVASIARVPLRIGYATEGRQRLLTHPLDLPEWRNSKHEIFYYLNIVEQLQSFVKPNENENFDSQPSGRLEVSPARQADARAMLEARGVNMTRKKVGDSGRPVIALCPGSTNSRAKRWPTDRFATLADRFIDELGAEVLLIGSTGEIEVSRDVISQMRNPCTMLTGETDLAELVAVLSVVDLLITNDTGPAHIGAALMRPTLVIFGPTNPLTTRPFSATSEIVREPPDCAPCMLRDCPIDHRCMTAISPDQVFKRAQLMLAEKLQAVV
ncbi:MAG TPA: lipopolysaccharide heptosyltransferase II [Pyrinomonadaceae bacterium]|nr:lipopolysaccharide heptosyltransferase II [Pyrinomonadaceae bacterium]